MNYSEETNEEYQDGDEQGQHLLEYSVGEVCKCFYNHITRGERDDAISQTTCKCQGFCRVIDRDPSDRREYTVEVFEPVGERIKRLPGCCLRKVKLLPYSASDAVGEIGKILRSVDGKEHMLVVAVSENAGEVLVNDIEASVLLKEFVHKDDGSPCGRIVMLKADEAFADMPGSKYFRGEEKRIRNELD